MGKSVDDRISEKGFWYDSNGISCVDYTSVVELIEEQHARDIEKACVWLAENADKYSRSSLTDIDRYLWVDAHIIEDFRKAMED